MGKFSVVILATAAVSAVVAITFPTLNLIWYIPIGFVVSMAACEILY